MVDYNAPNGADLYICSYYEDCLYVSFLFFLKYYGYLIMLCKDLKKFMKLSYISFVLLMMFSLYIRHGWFGLRHASRPNRSYHAVSTASILQ